jgi:hypothetical protein
MKTLLFTSLLSTLGIGLATPIWRDGPYGGPTPLNSTVRPNSTSLEARKTYNPPDFWKDAFGQISKGYFSIVIHSGNLDFYSELGSDWYTWSDRVNPCNLPDVTPYPTPGWKAIIKADPDIHLHHPFWFHPGNQCGGAKSKGEQLDNVSTPPFSPLCCACFENSLTRRRLGCGTARPWRAPIISMSSPTVAASPWATMMARIGLSISLFAVFSPCTIKEKAPMISKSMAVDLRLARAGLGDISAMRISTLSVWNSNI